MKVKFSSTFFPRTTAEIRNDQKKNLALDIKHRCHKIYSSMYKKYEGQTQEISIRMPRIIETTLDCYSGTCRNCRKYSMVCGGPGRDTWWDKSRNLKRVGLKHLNVTEHDWQLLRDILKLRLGPDALHLTKTNLNTNKNEGSNRGLSASLPKNVNFSRNAPARACSVVHRLNNGAAKSLLLKLQAEWGSKQRREGSKGNAPVKSVIAISS